MNELEEVYRLELTEKEKIKIATRILYENAVERNKSLKLTTDKDCRIFLLRDLEAINYIIKKLEGELK